MTELRPVCMECGKECITNGAIIEFTCKCWKKKDTMIEWRRFKECDKCKSIFKSQDMVDVFYEYCKECAKEVK